MKELCQDLDMVKETNKHQGIAKGLATIGAVTSPKFEWTRKRNGVSRVQ